jgi:hypothetical protein
MICKSTEPFCTGSLQIIDIESGRLKIFLAKYSEPKSSMDNLTHAYKKLFPPGQNNKHGGMNS